MAAHADELLSSPASLMSVSKDASVDNIPVGWGRRVLRENKCAYCHKVFKRSEHCIRHQRTHTNERPYSCRYCLKSYARKDLVTRHERTLHAQAQAEDRLLAERVSDGLVAPEETLREEGIGGGQWRALVDAAVAATDNTTDNTMDNTTENTTSNRDNPTSTTIGSSVLVALGRSPSSPNSLEASPNPNSGLRGAGSSSSLSSTVLSATRRIDADSCLSMEDVQRNLSLEEIRQSGGTVTPSTRVPSVSRPDIQQASRMSQGFTGLADNLSVYNIREQVPMQIASNHQQPDDPTWEQVGQYHQMPFIEKFEQYHRPQQYDHSIEKPPSRMDHGQTPSTLHAPPFEMPCFTFSPLSGETFGLSNNATLLQLQEYMELQDVPSMQLDMNAQEASIHITNQSGRQEMVKVSSDTAATGQPSVSLQFAVDDRSHSSTPTIILDHAAYEYMCTDLSERFGCPHLARQLPSARMCQTFFSSFLESFHCHLPIIHLGTLNLNRSPSPLILAICSIGAVYRLDRHRARPLYEFAREAIENSVALPSNEMASNASPLWVVQTKVLLTTYATLSGDKDLAATVMNENGFYTLVYGRIRQALADEDADLGSMIWTKWAQRESWKRLIGAIFVLSTLIVVIYDVNPGFGTTQDLELEMLHDESLWVATTVNEWRELRENYVSQDCRSVKDILTEILSESKTRLGTASAPCRVSPFFALFIMHAVLIHMRQLLQITQVIGRASSALSSGKDDSMGSWLRHTANKSLDRCQQFLRANQDDMTESDATSLVFTCETVLRMARIRLFSYSNAFNRLSLMEVEPAAVEASVSAFAASKLDRGQDLLDAVEKSFEGLKISIKMGHLLVRKTAALRWSVEHAVAGWDCALFTSKWVHSVEIDILQNIKPSPAEKALLVSMREVLEEADYELGETGSLAAGVARVSSWFLQDVWVWGLTPQMGEVLEQLASAYERANQAGRRSSNSSGL